MLGSENAETEVEAEGVSSGRREFPGKTDASPWDFLRGSL